MTAKKILITGSSGFIGSFLVEKSLSMGWHTWAGVRKTSNRQYLQDDRIRFVDLPFADKSKLAAQLKELSARYGRFDYIIHNAGVTKCLKSSGFDKVNYHYAVNFIEALKEADCVPDKFIYMSSLSVMGLGDESKYTPFKIENIPNPNTAYGKSKLKTEEYIRSQKDFPYLIFRPTGVYGPREKDYFLMLKTVKSGLDVSAGLQPQHLTFIYVKDLADAVFLGLKSEIKNKTYFVADGNVYTDREYTALVKEALGKKHVFRLKVPLWLLKSVSVVAEGISRLTRKPSTLNRDKYRIMKQRNWEVDISPLKSDLGFTAKYNLEEGLKESIGWYRENAWL